MPKNLSLPSLRIGPASSRCFSRGVKGGALGSFFDAEDPVRGLEACFRLGISVQIANQKLYGLPKASIWEKKRQCHVQDDAMFLGY